MLTTSLSDCVVVVTGAGGRLGQVLTSRLAGQGARVAALDRAEPDTLPPDARSFSADLTSEKDVVEVFESIRDTMGRMDALVHTVGMWAGQPLTETRFADWRSMMSVNLDSTFLCFREAARHMLSGGGGRLVGITSQQGAGRGVAEQAAYSASKAGVVRLVEAVAAEYRGRGISAVAVAPSTIRFGDEEAPTEGVRVEAVAGLCAYLCAQGADVHNGTVLRAFGTARV